VSLARTTPSGPLLAVDVDTTIDAGLVFTEAPVIVLPPVDPPGVILPPVAPPGSSGGDAAAAAGPVLAFTGSNVFWPSVIGLLLLGSGFVVVVLSRRRRAAR
jgi:LPXTG-motif cell wall-anchored protein